MKTIVNIGGKSKKQRTLGPTHTLSKTEFDNLDRDTKINVILDLIPLGLMSVSEMLENEVKELVGSRYSREGGQPGLARYGSNPGSVKLNGQRHPVTVPRVRNLEANVEVPLESWKGLHGSGVVDEILLNRVLYGISCRNYEAAAESLPGSIGLSKSTISRGFIEASAKQLKEFAERDLSSYDVVTIFLDGKTFAEDTMVIALGVTVEGEKVVLGFTQAGTENGNVITSFLQEMLDRGLRIDQGVLVVVDGSKGIRAAVKKAFKNKAIVQRCQWHKQENVISYLPKNEQKRWRKKLQRAYNKATYLEAKSALLELIEELESRNLSAANSLKEGLEETLTLHRLGMFEVLGMSLKTTNCMESIMSQVEERCGKVDCWKNSAQKHRWLAASLLDIEPRLRKVKGYKHLHLLRKKIQEELGIFQTSKAA